MPIRYSLVENHVSPNNNDFYPRIEITDSVNLQDVARKMAKRGSTVSETDALAVLQLGDYHLEVRARQRGAEALRVGRLEAQLAIVS